MFRKTVRISVNICPTDQAKQESSSIHTISIVLESGKSVFVSSWQDGLRRLANSCRSFDLDKYLPKPSVLTKQGDLSNRNNLRLREDEQKGWVKWRDISDCQGIGDVDEYRYF